MRDRSAPRPTVPPQGRRGLRSWTLALVLSGLLIVGWATFLVLAPPPEVARPPGLVAADAPAAPVPDNRLRLLIERGAIAADLLADFAADAGLKVEVESYDLPEQLITLADSGAIAHDIVLVSGVGLKMLTERNLLRTIAPADLTNAGNIDPALAARTVIYDAGNAHAVAISWATIGLGFNATKLAERLGPGATPDSWAALFEPANAAKLADCGIQVIDNPTGVFPVTLTYLGLPPASDKIEDTDAATRLWESVRPSIARFSSADVIDNLAVGAVCLAVATSADAYQARDKARIAGLGTDIRYVLPKEGTVVRYDFLAIPQAAANAAKALRFIDYMLRPEVAARLTNAKGVASAVLGSALYIKPEIKSDPGFSPDLANLRMVEEISPPPAAVALRNRFWQLINGPAAEPVRPPVTAPVTEPALPAAPDPAAPPAKPPTVP